MSSHTPIHYQGFHPASAPDFVPVAQMRKLQLARLNYVINRAYELTSSAP